MLYQVELRPSAKPVLPEGGDSAAKYRAGPMVRQRNARRNGRRAPQVLAGQSDNRPVEAGRPMALEAALFVLIVALPLAFFPQSRDAFLHVKILLLAGGRLLRRGSATSSRPSRTTR